MKYNTEPKLPKTLTGKPKIKLQCQQCGFTGNTSGLPTSCPACGFDPKPKQHTEE